MNENIKVVWFVNKVRQYAEQLGKKSSKSITQAQDTKVVMEVIKTRSETDGYNENQMDKLWRDIFATSFFASKFDITVHIAKLIHSFASVEEQQRFMRLGVQKILSFYRQATTADAKASEPDEANRVKNLHQLATNLLLENLVLVKDSDWDLDRVKGFCGILQKHVVCVGDDAGKKPFEWKMFCTKNYINMISSATQGKIQPESLHQLLLPYIKVLVFSGLNSYVQAAETHIIDKLLGMEAPKSKKKSKENTEESTKNVPQLKFSKESLIKDLQNLGATQFVKPDRRGRINAILKKLGASPISLKAEAKSQVAQNNKKGIKRPTAETSTVEPSPKRVKPNTNQVSKNGKAKNSVPETSTEESANLPQSSKTKKKNRKSKNKNSSIENGAKPIAAETKKVVIEPKEAPAKEVVTKPKKAQAKKVAAVPTKVVRPGILSNKVLSATPVGSLQKKKKKPNRGRLGTPNSKGRVLRIDTSCNTSQEYSEYINSMKLHRPVAEETPKKLVSVIKGSKSVNKKGRKLKLSSKYRNKLLFL